LYVNSVEKRFSNINGGKSLPGPVPSFLGLAELSVFAKGSFIALLEKYGHYGPLFRIFVGPFVWIVVNIWNMRINYIRKNRSYLE
jgi:hypothetical protein